MSERVLTVDLGNSRCKLVGFAVPRDRDARVEDETAFVTGPALARDVEAWIARQPRFDRCALSAVASPALEEELAVVLARTFGAHFLRQPDCGLSIAVRSPETVGRDRLYAARGAFALARGSAIVVDAGTALTVDAVRAPTHDAGRTGATSSTPQGSSASPSSTSISSPSSSPSSVARSASNATLAATFLGGSIAPGPWLLADALARHAARLPHVEPEPGAHALGRDTREALQAGVVVGFRGAAAQLARDVARESDLRDAPVVVTGGARAFLLEPTPCFEARTIVDAYLVHRGLLAAARDAR